MGNMTEWFIAETRRRLDQVERDYTVLYSMINLLKSELEYLRALRNPLIIPVQPPTYTDWNRWYPPYYVTCKDNTNAN